MGVWGLAGKVVDLRALYLAVVSRGGFDAVSTARAWPQLPVQLGYLGEAAAEGAAAVGSTLRSGGPSAAAAAALRALYQKLLLRQERQQEAMMAAASQAPPSITQGGESAAPGAPDSTGVLQQQAALSDRVAGTIGVAAVLSDGSPRQIPQQQEPTQLHL